MKKLVLTTICIALSASTFAQQRNTQALQTQAYGPAPSYDPPRGHAISTQAPGAIQTATNPNPEAYKYTKEYQSADAAHQQAVDSGVKRDQAVLNILRKRQAASGSAGGKGAGRAD